jgi:hypothetical protein
MGFRVVIDDFELMDVYNVLNDGIVNSIEYKVKFIDSSKNDYKALHLYFYGDNKFFPWELQIWRKSDFQKNEESHLLHKQEYTKWATIYKDEVLKKEV